MSSPRRPGAPSGARPAARASAKPTTARTATTTGASRETRAGSRRSPATGAIRTTTSRPGTGPGRTSRAKATTASAAKTPGIAAGSASGSWAGMLTWRTAIIVFVAILAFAVVWPTARAYLEQQDMLDGLRADAAAAQAEVDDLSADLARWDDDAFIEAQARERLTYVYPGETAYRVLDPETLEAAADAQDAAADGEAAAQGDTWYDALWNSVEVAGETGAGARPGSGSSSTAGDASGDDN